MQEGSCRVASEVQNVSQAEVGDRATLNANLLFLHDFLEFWVEGNVEAVTDSLGVQQDRIIQLLVILLVGLTAVQINWELDSELSGLGSSLVDLWQELIDWWREVLLVDHIKANDHIGVLLRVEKGINLRLNVVLSDDFESACDNLHLEEWESVLDDFLDPFKDSALSFETDVAIFVKHHAEDMFPFDHSHALLNHVSGCSVEILFKELSIVVQIICHHELWLEVFPDGVVLLGLDGFVRKKYRLTHEVVKVG